MVSLLRRHVRAVLFITTGLILWGIYAAATMPVAIFPALTIPRIIIAVEGGDAPPKTVLSSVTRPLESALSTIPDLQLLESQTTRGSVGMTLTFRWGIDVSQVLQLVNARISEARESLPPGLDITAEKLNPTVFPILDYSMTSRMRSLANLRSLAIYTLKPRLSRLPGVARILVNGGAVQEYQVLVSPDRLAAHGLDVSQVSDALRRANSLTAVGNYDDHSQRHLVLVNGLLEGAGDIEKVVVDIKDRIPVMVGDLATVSETFQRQTVIATGSGRPAVLLNIVRQPTGNTIQVAQEVKQELASLRSLLPRDVTIEPFYDQSEIVGESIFSVIEAVVVGGVLALCVLVVFLHSGKAAFTALSLLPLTLIISFGVMKLAGLDLNIMTLGGLAIALGLVIDDSIVVVEHIYFHLERGIPREEAIPTSLREITPPMLASSLASIVTFLPMLFLPGVTGNFLSALAVTLLLTLSVSLILSLTVCPLIGLWVLPRRLTGRSPGYHPTDGVDSTDQSRGKSSQPASHTLTPAAAHQRRGVFFRFVHATLLRRSWILIGLVPLGLGSYWLSTKLASGFMPEFDEGAIVIDYKMPAGTSLTETDRNLRQVEKILKEQDGVQSWSRLTGAASGSGLEIMPQNQGDILVRLKRGPRPPVDDISSDLRKEILTAVPNVELDFAQILGDLIGDLSGSPSPIEVKVFGPDIDQLRRLAHEVGQRISAIHGVVDEFDGITEGGPETEVKVDPVRAGEAGLSTDSVAAAASAALDGEEVGSVFKGEIPEPIRVRYPGPPEPEIDNAMLGAIPILTPSGHPVPLSSVGTVTAQPGEPDLNHENQRLVAAVTARLEGLDLGSAIQQVKKTLAPVALPPGYAIEYGGLYKSQQQSFHDLTVVLIVTILLIVSVLVMAFRSFRATVALLSAALLSLSGVVVALFLTNTPFNISSFTGAIMVVGIVVENGVLLFTELLRLERSGTEDLTREEMLAAAAAARLRPILMMEFAAILTLLPLSFGIGAGAAMQKPLAVAVIGGVALSMLFTLIAAPAIYASLTDISRGRRR